MTFDGQAATFRDIVEHTLDEVLPSVSMRPTVLSQAMRYAVGSGGKRIRPLICLGASVAVGGTADDARYTAAAIEILHNYTLVHDDLPAMDNDTERRGQPSVWAKFGEANAILAGDALLALAYRVAARAPRQVSQIVDELGDKGVGVVQGQVEDVARATGTCDAATVEFVYTHKTADLFMAAAVMGALAGGGSSQQVESLRTFARHLGLAFQYEDDLLDGDSPFEPAETERRVRESTHAAVTALTALPGDTSFLTELANRLVGRAS